jgi:hypothetical protein
MRRCGLRTVFYLIEGAPDLLAPTDQRIVKSAAASLEVVDNFHVLRTRSELGGVGGGSCTSWLVASELWWDSHIPRHPPTPPLQAIRRRSGCTSG